MIHERTRNTKEPRFRHNMSYRCISFVLYCNLNIIYMKNNLISLLLYILVIVIYAVVQEYPLLFMWLTWIVGFSKNIWNNLD